MKTACEVLEIRAGPIKDLGWIQSFFGLTGAALERDMT